MAVKIRMKRTGRKNRPFYRVCAVNIRSPRDGKVIEEIGHYDPMIGEVDARTVLNQERVTYWLSVGALPSDRVGILIKKYGPNGTHKEQQQAALARIAARRPKTLPKAPVIKTEAPAASPEPAAPAQS